MSGIVGGAGSKSGVIGTTELDYEKGTWTPVFKGNNTGSVIAHTISHATYVKIGKFVTCQFLLSVLMPVVGLMLLHGQECHLLQKEQAIMLVLGLLGVVQVKKH